MTLMSNDNRPPSDGHPPLPSLPVSASQQVSEELAPLIKQLNQVIDGLERLAGAEEGEHKDDDADC